MAYEMMYFQKEAASQISMDIYASYADSFDLSLLKNVTDEKKENISQMSPEYIPATIYPDSMQSLKKSLAWNQPQQVTDVPMEEDPCAMFSAQNIHNYKQNFYSYPLPSPPQETTVSSSTASPPAYQFFNSAGSHVNIKQEHIILPPSPPESDAAFESDADVVKNEPTEQNTATATTTTEPPSCIDIEYFLKSSFDSMNQSTLASNSSSISDNDSDKKDHQLLRECLQDTSFQKKHNLRPVALESLFNTNCGWNLRGDIEPVISLALEQAKCDIQATCAALDISPDPKEWTTEQAHLWLRSTIQQFKLPAIPNMENIFPENGEELSQLSEDEFIERCPQAGSTLHGQLEVWIAACPDVSYTPTTIESLGSETIVENPSDICMSTVIKSEIDETSIASPLSTVSCNNISTTVAPSSPSAQAPASTSKTSTANSTSSTTTTTATSTATRQGSAHIHLWQFLKELLSAPQTYGTALRWIDRKQGIFKIEDSVRVARLWGRRKNRPAMNYDKLSRSIRQYYKKGIMKKTERSQRLVYQFCHPYFL
ncbi:DNA-binding protein D-ETS-4 [Culicoides brevitarsis]|uniref:DNA-binding protein D-ETS-4 n=1 Tax=Culicoides brevitarsis TaxID=469753 RepID=UPI00307B8536